MLYICKMHYLQKTPDIFHSYFQRLNLVILWDWQYSATVKAAIITLNQSQVFKDFQNTIHMITNELLVKMYTKVIRNVFMVSNCNSMRNLREI